MHVGTCAAAAAVAAGGSGECILTSDRCHCSEQVGSGECMKYQGGDKCLMGQCNDGYKCDCFGFELCTRRVCAKYTTKEGVIPHQTLPFGCHLTDNAGECIDFSEFSDTVQGAGYAQEAANEYNKEAAADNREMTQAVQGIDDSVEETNKAMGGIAGAGHLVTEEEFAEAEADANIVMEACVRASEEKALAAQESKEAYKSFIEASKFRAKAQELEKKADEREDEEKDERRKNKDKPKCDRCEELKREAKELRRKRREAAIAAGTWAKKARGHKKKSKARKRKVKKEQLSASEARKRCVDRWNKILARLNRNKRAAAP